MRTHAARYSVLILAWSLTAISVPADQEASNTPHVTTNKYGHFYAKSVPAEHYGTAGRTMVYRVTDTEDVLLHTYPWFASRIFLEGYRAADDVTVVQMGPWARGSGPQEDHLAFAIYKGAKLVKRYSTLAISNLGVRPSRSISHYSMFREIPGLQRPWGNQLVFEVITHGRNRLTFDVDTGDLMTADDVEIKGRLQSAASVISRIKSDWYRRHEGEVPDIRKHEITEAELRETDAAAFPELPAGYRYIPDAIWQPVRFEKRK